MKWSEQRSALSIAERVTGYLIVGELLAMLSSGRETMRGSERVEDEVRCAEGRCACLGLGTSRVTPGPVSAACEGENGSRSRDGSGFWQRQHEVLAEKDYLSLKRETGHAARMIRLVGGLAS